MKDFVLEKIESMRKNGYSTREIADFFGLTTVELIGMVHKRSKANRIVLMKMAKEMSDAGDSVSEIAEKLDLKESSVRLLLSGDPPTDFSKSEHKQE